MEPQPVIVDADQLAELTDLLRMIAFGQLAFGTAALVVLVILCVATAWRR